MNGERQGRSDAVDEPGWWFLHLQSPCQAHASVRIKAHSDGGREADEQRQALEISGSKKRDQDEGKGQQARR